MSQYKPSRLEYIALKAMEINIVCGVSYNEALGYAEKMWEWGTK